MAKSWKEKLNNKKDLPKVEYFAKNSKNWPNGNYVIPAPTDVDVIMKKVSRGKLITIKEIRQTLAKEHKADYALANSALPAAKGPHFVFQIISHYYLLFILNIGPEGSITFYGPCFSN